tara:strand:+ start:270 stop:467 length:198 start_codon:yes stop_codon:yes gene_type:complete
LKLEKKYSISVGKMDIPLFHGLVYLTTYLIKETRGFGINLYVSTLIEHLIMKILILIVSLFKNDK